MDLSIRIQILKDAGQISEDTRLEILKIIEMFKKKYDIKLTESNGAMLVTHLCVALERIKKGELVNRIDSSIFEEVRNNENFVRAEKVIADIEELLRMEISQIEQDFIMMHLCVLLQSTGN